MGGECVEWEKLWLWHLCAYNAPFLIPHHRTATLSKLGHTLCARIFIGSFISAKAYKEFEWRALNGMDFLRSVCGGVLMGVGAYLAGGCTATNALVATAYFSWQGWIAMTAMIVGCVIGSSFFRVKHCELRRK